MIHILLAILLSGPAPLGIASLPVAVEKTQTELEGLDIVDGSAGEQGVWDAPLRPPDPGEAAETMHGLVDRQPPRKKSPKKTNCISVCACGLHIQTTTCFLSMQK